MQQLSDFLQVISFVSEKRTEILFVAAMCRVGPTATVWPCAMSPERQNSQIDLLNEGYSLSFHFSPAWSFMPDRPFEYCLNHFK